MPPRSAKRSGRAKAASTTKPKTRAAARAVKEEEQRNQADGNKNTVAQADTPPRPVFDTFETAAPLTSGLCIVRKLADGKYEILNLSEAEATALGSIEAGGFIRADQTGYRLKFLEEVEEAWKDSGFKISQALGSARLKIFRFLKLPIELRFKIYDYTVASNTTLRIGSYKYSPENILAGVQLTATCRQIHDETRKMFWRNNFRIDDICARIKPLIPTLSENLVEVTWTWWGFKNKDPKTLRTLAQCKQLKKFHLCLTKYCAPEDAAVFYMAKQFLHRDEPAVQKFKDSNAFDALFGLRGFELVTVSNHKDPSLEVPLERVSEGEMKAFESFLSQKLTQPKQPDEKSVKKGKKTAKKNKSGV